ncbi:MAG: LuxR C-terminal-related transcriptional regulator [Nitrospirota bacterium]
MMQKSYSQDLSVEDLLQKRELPAILVVELPARVVFASDEAAKFLKESLPQIRGNGNPHFLLPTQIADFCKQSGRVTPQTDEAPPRQAMVFRSPSEQHYLVMALSLGRSTSPSGRKLIFLVVQRIGQRKSLNPERLGDVYGLTKREQEVVTRLVQGDSNKEIAASLNIQEYTVKDHLKHIMAKCQAGSRTSILTKLLNL